MARPKVPSVREIANQVLRDVNAEQRVKTAEARVLRNAQRPAPPPETKLTGEMRKLAQDCRQQSDDITYEDLQEFVTNAR